MSNVALINIFWSDVAMSPGPPTSSYTGPYATNQTAILKGDVVPDKIPSDVVAQWIEQGLVTEV
jgi:hypothetical protein